MTWISSLFADLKLQLSRPPTVWCANLSKVMLSANPIQHAWTKHVKLDLYFVREKVQSDTLIVKRIGSADQIADILTK